MRNKSYSELHTFVCNTLAWSVWRPFYRLPGNTLACLVWLFGFLIAASLSCHLRLCLERIAIALSSIWVLLRTRAWDMAVLCNGIVLGALLDCVSPFNISLQSNDILVCSSSRRLVADLLDNWNISRVQVNELCWVSQELPVHPLHG